MRNLNQDYHFQKAENSLKYYKNYKGDSEQEKMALEKEFERLKMLADERKNDNEIRFSDFGNAFSSSCNPQIFQRIFRFLFS